MCLEKIIKKCKENQEILWVNPNYDKNYLGDKFSIDDIKDANERLLRFAPFIKKVYPKTSDTNGVIESKLTKVNLYGLENFYVKEDNNLPIAGSVKARGGIYEVLKYAENLANENNLIDENEDYSQFASDKFRNLFKEYTIEVGSTGNLGISIGLISRGLGFNVNIHMSNDAKEWKKNLLKDSGANVIEYKSNYSYAVKMGRENSKCNAKSYFVDDENSENLFLGYTTAALRLKEQLKEKNIKVDDSHPIFVYIPCGVGGAPGGILYGLKEILGSSVHVFFVEPLKSPSMLIGMINNAAIDVNEFGIDGKTDADGLAVSKASTLALSTSKKTLAGIFTIKEESLNPFVKELYQKEKIFAEPSAATSLIFSKFLNSVEYNKFLKENTIDKEKITHISWLTGGRLVPEEERKKYI